MIALRLVASTLLVAALSLACSETDCDLAEDRIEECGVDNAALTGSGVACEELAACEAACVLGASCGQIVAVLSQGEANELRECVLACSDPNVEPG